MFQLSLYHNTSWTIESKAIVLEDGRFITIIKFRSSAFDGKVYTHIYSVLILLVLYLFPPDNILDTVIKISLEKYIDSLFYIDSSNRKSYKNHQKINFRQFQSLPSDISPTSTCCVTTTFEVFWSYFSIDERIKRITKCDIIFPAQYFHFSFLTKQILNIIYVHK